MEIRGFPWHSVELRRTSGVAFAKSTTKAHETCPWHHESSRVNTEAGQDQSHSVVRGFTLKKVDRPKYHWHPRYIPERQPHL